MGEKKIVTLRMKYKELEIFYMIFFCDIWNSSRDKKYLKINGRNETNKGYKNIEIFSLCNQSFELFFAAQE